jgi:hypothetical protein
MLYIDSILRRERGSKLLRTVFWWTVLRTSGTDFLRNPRGNANEGADQQHLNENNNGQAQQNNNQV